MILERIIRIAAGTFVLAAVALGAPASPLFVDARFLWFAAFVGVNLLQSGFTRFCPLESILRKAGVGRASPTPAAPSRSRA